mmetsp:Transcript_202/g.312  ORF Transcript_202/g.312 Transcript_202/m.312 type:complete len:528 (+) Transcript_202:34-1617(+)
MSEANQIDPANDDVEGPESSLLKEGDEIDEVEEIHPVNVSSVRFTKTNTEAIHALKEEDYTLVKDLEAKRKEFYDEHINRQQKFWDLLKDMVLLSNEEGDLVCQWFKARVHAIRGYATSLAAVNDSIASLKAGTTYNSIRDSKPLDEGQIPKGKKFKIRGAAGAAEGNGRLLDELCGMDHIFAKNLVEKLNIFERNGNAALVHRQEAITADVIKAIERGDLYLKTMKMNEKFVDFLYNRYQKIATDFLQIKPESGQESKNKADMWLASLHYEIGVAQQRKAWLASLDLLDTLFTDLRNLEMDRRATFKTAIELMLEMHTESWGGQPKGYENVDNCLKRMDIDGEELQKQIKDALDQQMIDEGFETTAADGSFFESLRDPLDSKLIVKASINRRKGLMSYKNMSIFVLTVDHQLHMFDAKKKSSKDDLKGMFGELIPQIDPSIFPTMKPKKIAKKFMLKANKTLNLRIHESGTFAKQNNVKEYERFYIKQIRQKKFLMVKRYTSKKTCHVQASSQEERDEWLKTFQNL